MKFMKSIALAALAASALTSAANAATVTFNDRTAFQSTLSRSFTDTFETNLGYRAPFTIYGNNEISAVVGQTRYESTGFTNFNFLVNFQGSAAYCSGCNGSFKLTFDATTFGTTNGVEAVGLDVGFNQNFDALVTFGDNSSQLFGITRNANSFFGLTSDKLIKSISFGPGGGTTTSTSFVFDNLTIGAAGAGVPEPATWAMMIVGFGLIGASARRRRQSVRTVAA
jgi:PEP-CTERM motif